jgi:hypothetical protein
MATTTTNFGWDIPQSTDLVKDGATAIAALGQDIDTAFVDFKGGTTGQVLKKTSGTDLDVEWGTASSGGLTLINTTTFTGVSSQSFNDVFSATYDNYKIIMKTTHTLSAKIEFRYRVGGVDASGNNYVTQRSSEAGTSATANSRNIGNNIHSLGTNTDTQHFNMIELQGPFLAASSGLFYFETNGANIDTAGGEHNLSTSYDGFTLFSSAGNMTGTLRLYGYSN